MVKQTKPHPIELLVEDLHNMLESYSNEYQLSYAEVIGVLQITIADLTDECRAIARGELAPPSIHPSVAEDLDENSATDPHDLTDKGDFN